MSRPESRRSRRIPWRGRIELFRSRVPVIARARDVSTGGLFIETRERLPEGSYLTVRIALPGIAPFTSLCRVTRVTTGRGLLVPGGIGLRFLDVDPARHAQIAQFVDRHESAPPMAAFA